MRAKRETYDHRKSRGRDHRCRIALQKNITHTHTLTHAHTTKHMPMVDAKPGNIMGNGCGGGVVRLMFAGSIPDSCHPSHPRPQLPSQRTNSSTATTYAYQFACIDQHPRFGAVKSDNREQSRTIAGASMPSIAFVQFASSITHRIACRNRMHTFRVFPCTRVRWPSERTCFAYAQRNKVSLSLLRGRLASVIGCTLRWRILASRTKTA